MSVTRVASRYAKSLLELAISESTLDRVVEDVALFEKSMQSRELTLLLKSPIINADKKMLIIKSLFGDKMSDLTMSFLIQIIKKSRENVLAEIIQEFSSQYRQLNHVTFVKLTTAVPPSDTLINQIKHKLEHSGVVSESVEIKTIIDPEIIGGYILEFGDKLFDASVTYQLESLKKSFSN